MCIEHVIIADLSGITKLILWRYKKRNWRKFLILFALAYGDLMIVTGPINLQWVGVAASSRYGVSPTILYFFLLLVMGL
jgi:hypothetical protein